MRAHTVQKLTPFLLLGETKAPSCATYTPKGIIKLILTRPSYRNAAISPSDARSEPIARL